MGWITKETETAPCTVTISHRFEELSAHVRFDDGTTVNPGDTVQVQGPEIMAAFGELVEEQRTAVITRASKLEQLWTRATGDFEFMELCEFSFSEEVLS
ncbi:hypothetical protein [Loktanella sp. SALINAS62]|uniref:hypothetical protein n=1 Tax=Loktanella sp. SALINAS62 TaxID=2706124 RepID=UPI001B8B073D|nr:hypothetical protein [Loktanella sp. SALINAS62]MBS1302286.1 hypothetical protein [Loktanella sp. SALINAS62]